MIIGIDFDNTIVSYDDVLFETALRRGLIDQGAVKNKKLIRDIVRQLSDGETKWQKLQAFIYGEGMKQAELIAGVKDFFKTCRENAFKVYVVSHKTEHASTDRSVNLRQYALQWMRDQKFFDRDGLGLEETGVFFESTREEKINRIRELECTHFIDDLMETFDEPSFPGSVEKILFAPLGDQENNNIQSVRSWKEIHEHFFTARV